MVRFQLGRLRNTPNVALVVSSPISVLSRFPRFSQKKWIPRGIWATTSFFYRERQARRFLLATKYCTYNMLNTGNQTGKDSNVFHLHVRLCDACSCINAPTNIHYLYTYWTPSRPASPFTRGYTPGSRTWSMLKNKIPTSFGDSRSDCSIFSW